MTPQEYYKKAISLGFEPNKSDPIAFRIRSAYEFLTEKGDVLEEPPAPSLYKAGRVGKGVKPRRGESTARALLRERDERDGELPIISKEGREDG